MAKKKQRHCSFYPCNNIARFYIYITALKGSVGVGGRRYACFKHLVNLAAELINMMQHMQGAFPELKDQLGK